MARKLEKVAETAGRALQNSTTSGGGGGGAGGDLIIKAPGGGIPGRSGTTLGSATCTVYDRSSATITLSSRTETVYNVSTGAVGANKVGKASYDKDGGLVVDVESCA
jgi:hypothetical protein